MYLGRSPEQSKEKNLVHNLHTGIVLRQIHLKLDSTLKTIQELGGLTPKYFWQICFGFNTGTLPDVVPTETQAWYKATPRQVHPKREILPSKGAAALPSPPVLPDNQEEHQEEPKSSPITTSWSAR
jgi:hypothetical protein